MNEGVEALAKLDVTGARRAIEAAIQIDPDYPQAHVNMARLHIAAQHYLDAERALRRALELVGSSDRSLRAAIHYDLGRTYLERAKDPQIDQRDRENYAKLATQSFGAAAEDAPGDYQAHHQRGLAHDLLDSGHEADRSLRACIEIQPRYAPCYADLARIYFDFGVPKLAEAVLETAVKVDDKSAELWLAFAKLHLELGRPQEAVDAGKKAKAVAPDRVEVMFVLGIAHAQAGQSEEAIQSLSNYLAKRFGEPDGRVRAAQDALMWLLPD